MSHLICTQSRCDFELERFVWAWGRIQCDVRLSDVLGFMFDLVLMGSNIAFFNKSVITFC